MATNAPTPLLTPPPGVAPAPTPTNAPGATNALALQDIRDIKPPVAIPDWTWLWWALGALLLGALLGWWWWRRRQRKPVAEKEVDVKKLVPPHVRAKERLEAALKFIRQPKPFCTAVSDALRWYLEEQFDLRAPERTTEEFLDELQASPQLDVTQKQLLADFLARCDLVKFAREEPSEPELRELHGVALRLVVETEPSRSADREPAAPETGPSSDEAKPAASPPPAPQS
jgi:hypothetical protein